MTTTTDNNNYSLSTLGRQIELNRKSGWGLERGSPEQLNLIALYCQHLRLLPGEDITLYEGKPWLTIDGRIKLMRRHPDYRGHATRPLSPDEKELWGYDPDDLVIEATIRTATCGEIQARGMVRKAERIGQGGGRLNPVARTHPVEMAEKRALSRAERFAFGAEAVTEEDLEAGARVIVEQRNDPERVARLAAEHERIFGDEDGEPSPRRTVDTATGEVTESDELSEEISTALDTNARLQQWAREIGVLGLKALRAEASWTLGAIADANAELQARIDSRQHDASPVGQTPLV